MQHFAHLRKFMFVFVTFCVMLMSASVSGVAEFDVRISPGPYAGRVDVFHGGQWGEACYSGNDHATIARLGCRNLGFDDGRSVMTSQKIRSTSPGFRLKIESCPSNATLYAHCLVGDHSNCTSKDAFAVSCYNNQGVFPTVPGISYGIPRVFLDGTKVGVCALGFGDQEARVLCGYGGYSNGSAFHNTFSPVGGLDMRISNLSCPSSALTLDDCTYGVFESSQCDTTEAVGIRCQDGHIDPDSQKLTWRLSQGTYGKVLVSYVGVDGFLCMSSNLSQSESDAICASFGLSMSIPLFGNPFNPIGPEYATAWVKDLACTQNNLTQCSYRGPGGNAGSLCDVNKNSVSIVCLNSSQPHAPQLYLDGISGQENLGYVELIRDNIKGTLASPNLTHNTASVLCGELGFEFGIVFKFAIPREEYLITWLQDLTCDGSELTFADCNHMEYGAGIQNDHSNDIVVGCYNAVDKATDDLYQFASQPTLQLGDFVGAVDVRHNGLYGSVCDESWTDVEAMVFCRSMNFQSGTRLTIPVYHRPLWLQSIKCSGNETSLSECVHSPWGEISGMCNPIKSAGAVCFNTLDPFVEFRLDQNYNFGMVMIGLSGIWKPASITNQHVRSFFCEQLGFHYRKRQSLTGQKQRAWVQYNTAAICASDDIRNCTSVFGIGFASEKYYQFLYCSPEADNYIEPACTGSVVTLDDEVGVVQLPGYPETLYAADTTCTWHVVAPPGRRIVLTFDSKFISVNESGPCRDSLIIRDGLSNSAPIVKKYCGGPDAPGTIRTRTNQSQIVWTTDSSSDANTGFGAWFRFECDMYTGQKFWMKTFEGVFELLGNSYMVREVTLLECMDLCDVDSLCLHLFFDGSICYMQMTGFVGKSLNSSLHLSKYEYRCVRALKSWDISANHDAAESMHVLRQNMKVDNISFCQIECENHARCGSFVYNDLKNECALYSKTANIGLTPTSRKHHYKLKLTGLSSCTSWVDYMTKLSIPVTSGYYLVNTSNSVTPVYCRISESGAWMLIMNVVNKIWNESAMLYHNTDDPGLSMDYSRLGDISKINNSLIFLASAMNGCWRYTKDALGVVTSKPHNCGNEQNALLDAYYSQYGVIQRMEGTHAISGNTYHYVGMLANSMAEGVLIGDESLANASFTLFGQQSNTSQVWLQDEPDEDCSPLCITTSVCLIQDIYEPVSCRISEDNTCQPGYYPYWANTESGRRVIADSSIRPVDATLAQCFALCDAEVCEYFYYDHENQVCYMKEPHGYGDAFVGTIDVELYTRVCRACEKSWSMSKDIGSVNQLALKELFDVTLADCQTSCENEFLCLSFDFFSNSTFSICQLFSDRIGQGLEYDTKLSYDHYEWSCSSYGIQSCDGWKLFKESRGQVALDGVYPITINNDIMFVFCDMTTMEDAWLLVFNGLSRLWSDSALEDTNMEIPDTEADYSILKYADILREDNTHADFYQLRIENVPPSSEVPVGLVFSTSHDDSLMQGVLDSDNIHIKKLYGADSFPVQDLAPYTQPYRKVISTGNKILTVTRSVLGYGSGDVDGVLTASSEYQGKFLGTVPGIMRIWMRIPLKDREPSCEFHLCAQNQECTFYNKTHECPCSDAAQQCDSAPPQSYISGTMKGFNELRDVRLVGQYIKTVQGKHRVHCILQCVTEVACRSVTYYDQPDSTGQLKCYLSEAHSRLGLTYSSPGYVIYELR